MKNEGAGFLARHRVTIQSHSLAQDIYGDPKPTWTNVVTDLPANVQAVSGSEAPIGEQTKNVYVHKVTIYYRSDVTPGCRVIHGSKTYNVVSALDIEGSPRWLELICREDAGI